MWRGQRAVYRIRFSTSNTWILGLNSVILGRPVLLPAEPFYWLSIKFLEESSSHSKCPQNIRWHLLIILPPPLVRGFRATNNPFSKSQRSVSQLSVAWQGCDLALGRWSGMIRKSRSSIAWDRMSYVRRLSQTAKGEVWVCPLPRVELRRETQARSWPLAVSGSWEPLYRKQPVQL